MSLQTFLYKNWNQLVLGRKLEIQILASSILDLGFEELAIAEPNGQIKDYAIPLSDGSRVHLQEYPGNKFFIHRDKYDPNKSLRSMANHLLTETWIGPTIIAVGVTYLLLKGKK